MIMVNTEWDGPVPNGIFYWIQYENMGNINPRQSDSFFFFLYHFWIFIYFPVLVETFRLLHHLQPHSTVRTLSTMLQNPHSFTDTAHTNKKSGQCVLFDSIFRSLNSRNILFCLITHRTFQHFSLCRFSVLRTMFIIFFFLYFPPFPFHYSTLNAFMLQLTLPNNVGHKNSSLRFGAEYVKLYSYLRFLGSLFQISSYA